MNSFRKNRPVVSHCETHHLGSNNQPVYNRRFDQVLPFHEPGLAPVSLNQMAWHIKLDGNDAYSERFERSFGFYCGLASVNNGNDWFHIKPDGQALYVERYNFVGNFQDDCCVVCDVGNYYFHIDTNGHPLYTPRWLYCGDFREGIAVVQGRDGLSTHINVLGEQTHSHWFVDLDVFHKGFARAKDNLGWHHINRKGKPLYTKRFTQVEPFYNGCARVETQDGGLLVIDEAGIVLRELRPARRDYFAELSSDMVGYWRTFALSTAAELKVFDHLPTTSAHLSKILNADYSRLERLLRALAELDVLILNKGMWQLTCKGQYLCSTHEKTLRTAALEYGGDLLDRWRYLPAIIRGEEVSQDIFSSVATDSDRCNDHHEMLASYAKHDYLGVVDLLDISPEDVIFDAAGGSGTLSQLIAENNPKATIICGDLVSVATNTADFQAIEFDLFQPWPIKSNKVILARVLHDWKDEQVIEILRNAKTSLKPQGKVYVIEMLMSEGNFGGALCDLHLLTVTGGQERSLNEYQALLIHAGFSAITELEGPGTVSVLKAEVIND